MKTNIRKAPEGVNLDNIVSLLALVAAKEFPYPLIEPNSPLKEGENIKGVISSETTKRLFTVKLWLKDAAATEEAKHLKLHLCDTAVITEADCMASAYKVFGLKARAELLDRLMWLCVQGEFPQEAVNNAGLREGWGLVSLAGSEWDDLVLFSSPKDLPNQILGQLLAAATGTPFETDAKDIEGALDEKVGKKIGVVADPCARSFMAIERRLFHYADDYATSEGVPMNCDHEQFHAWMDTQVFGKLKRTAETIGYLAKLRMTLSELFWQAVYDTVPGSREAGSLVIRPGWELYEGVGSGGMGIGEIVIVDGKNNVIPNDSELGQALLRHAGLSGKTPSGRSRTTATATATS